MGDADDYRRLEASADPNDMEYDEPRFSKKEWTAIKRLIVSIQKDLNHIVKEGNLMYYSEEPAAFLINNYVKDLEKTDNSYPVECRKETIRFISGMIINLIRP